MVKADLLIVWKLFINYYLVCNHTKTNVYISFTTTHLVKKNPTAVPTNLSLLPLPDEINNFLLCFI